MIIDSPSIDFNRIVPRYILSRDGEFRLVGLNVKYYGDGRVVVINSINDDVLLDEFYYSPSSVIHDIKKIYSGRTR